MKQDQSKISTNLAIIPARAGSKGIPNKNLLKIGSKNLIEHAIFAAKNSSLLTDIIVTSDHPTILEIATGLSIEVRQRPIHMAQDDSPVVTCLQDAVSFIETTKKNQYHNVILLQPTSPIRTGKDIDNVIHLMDKNRSIEGVVSVSECGVFLPDHQYYLEYDNNLNNEVLIAINGESSQRIRRQEIPQSYVRNGAIYAARRSILMDENKIIVDKKIAYVMPKKYICNLDDYEDLDLAKVIVPAWENNLL
tara:strand:+ start:594 stop:1340 length:747 start_codon:yes stop_codon:yes gene_type:complete